MLRFIGNEHRWPEPQAKKAPTHRKLAAVSFYFVAMQGKLNVFTLERVCLTHYHSCEDWSQPSSAFLRELRCKLIQRIKIVSRIWNWYLQLISVSTCACRFDGLDKAASIRPNS